MDAQKEEKLLQKAFSEVGRRLDEVIERAQSARKEVREEVEQKVAHLRKEKEQLEHRLTEVRKGVSVRWQQAAAHASTAVQELSKAVQAVLGREEVEK